MKGFWCDFKLMAQGIIASSPSSSEQLPSVTAINSRGGSPMLMPSTSYQSSSHSSETLLHEVENCGAPKPPRQPKKPHISSSKPQTASPPPYIPYRHKETPLPEDSKTPPVRPPRRIKPRFIHTEGVVYTKLSRAYSKRLSKPQYATQKTSEEGFHATDFSGSLMYEALLSVKLPPSVCVSSSPECVSPSVCTSSPSVCVSSPPAYPPPPSTCTAPSVCVFDYLPDVITSFLVCEYLSLRDVRSVAILNKKFHHLSLRDEWLKLSSLHGGTSEKEGERSHFWLYKCCKVHLLQIAIAFELQWITACDLSNYGEIFGGKLFVPKNEDMDALRGEASESQHIRASRKIGNEAYRFLQNGTLCESKSGELLRDVSRTFPRHPMFSEREGSQGRSWLYEILHCLVCLDPATGYCQGMNFIVGSLLIHLKDPESVFWMTLALMRHYDYFLIFSPKVPLVPLRLSQFSRLARDNLPELHKHIVEQSLTIDFFTNQWLMTGFSYFFEPSVLSRVWDCFLVSGWKSMFRIGLAFLSLLQEQLMAKDIEGIIRLVQNSGTVINFSRPLEEGYVDLFKVARQFKVTNRMLKELASHTQAEKLMEMLSYMDIPKDMQFDEQISPELEKWTMISELPAHALLEHYTESGSSPDPRGRESLYGFLSREYDLLVIDTKSLIARNRPFEGVPYCQDWSLTGETTVNFELFPCSSLHMKTKSISYLWANCRSTSSLVQPMLSDIMVAFLPVSLCSAASSSLSEPCENLSGVNSLETRNFLAKKQLVEADSNEDDIPSKQPSAEGVIEEALHTLGVPYKMKGEKQIWEPSAYSNEAKSRIPVPVCVLSACEEAGEVGGEPKEAYLGVEDEVQQTNRRQRESSDKEEGDGKALVENISSLVSQRSFKLPPSEAPINTRNHLLNGLSSSLPDGLPNAPQTVVSGASDSFLTLREKYEQLLIEEYRFARKNGRKPLCPSNFKESFRHTLSLPTSVFGGSNAGRYLILPVTSLILSKVIIQQISQQAIDDSGSFTLKISRAEKEIAQCKRLLKGEDVLAFRHFRDEREFSSEIKDVLKKTLEKLILEGTEPGTASSEDVQIMQHKDSSEPELTKDIIDAYTKKLIEANKNFQEMDFEFKAYRRRLDGILEDLNESLEKKASLVKSMHEHLSATEERKSKVLAELLHAGLWVSLAPLNYGENSIPLNTL